MRVIDLAIKDWRQLLRDRQTVFFMAAMPILFTLFFGLIFGSAGGETDPRLPVAVISADSSSSLSSSLLSLLEASEAVRPVVEESVSAEEAGQWVRDARYAAALFVPAGFGETVEHLAEGKAERLASNGTIAGDEAMQATLIVDRSTPAGQTAANAIETAVTRLLSAAQIARLATEAFEASVPFEDQAVRQAFQHQALASASEAWREPPISVAAEQAWAAGEDEQSQPNAFAQSSPGMIIQFTIHGLMMTAMILVLERKTGALQRLLTTTMTRTQIIAAKVLGSFVTVFAQQALLVLVGQFAFGVDYLREPVATLAVMVALSLWVTSLGLLIGALARTEEHVHAWSLVAMFFFSALGGAWFPLEYTGKAFNTIGHLTPAAWALDGFQNIVMRGLGLQSVLLPVGIVVVYAVVFFGLAVWRFRFE